MAGTDTRVKRRKRIVKHAVNKKKMVRNRKKRDLLKPLLALLCVGIVGYCVYWTLTTPKLLIKKASVKGLKLLSPTLVWQDVRSAHGKNIFRLDTGDIRKRILKHPEVAAVRVGRRLPGTLTVHVTERTPAAVVRTGGSLYMVDASGNAFRTVNRPVTNLTLIELPSDSHPVLGRPLRGPNARSALECLRESTKNICHIDKISVDQRGNICLNIGSSYFVKLGQPVDISRKLSILRSTLEAKPGIAAKVLYFDISCLERPVWKPKESAGEVQAAGEPQDSANAVLR